MDREVRISRGKLLLYIESMDYKVLLYSTGDYMQYPVRNHNGKGYFKDKKVKVKVAQLCPTLCKPYSPWNSLGQHTRVGSLSLLQGIFPTQGSNPHLPHCRQILYQMYFKECIYIYIHQFSSVFQLCPTLCDPMNHSTPGLPFHHQLPELGTLPLAPWADRASL